jgi:hypothetical protein
MGNDSPKSPESVAENRKPSRRGLLAGGLLVLGAAALIQPNGGVIGAARADDAPAPIKKKGKKKKRDTSTPK